MDRDGWQLAERRRPATKGSASTSSTSSTSGAPSRDRTSRAAPAKQHRGCFNCGEEGHIAARCKHPVKCLRCKQVGHKSDACPKSSPRADASRLNRPAERQAPTMTSLGAKKRPREAGSSTGYTPETKRAATATSSSKFSYAQTAQGAMSLVVFHQDRRPVTAKEQENLEDEYNAYLIREATATTAADWLPEIAALRGAKILGRQVVVIDAKEERTATWVTDWVKRLAVLEGSSALSVEPMDNFRRRDLRKMTGFARGATGQKMKEEALLLLLRVSARRKGITGQIELSKVTPTPTGAVLTIEVDLTALEEMAQAGNILNVGSSGDVKFQETARRAGSLRMEAEKEELERRLAQVSKGLEAAKAEESANAMARMTVEEKGKGESEEESGEEHGEDTSGAEGGRKDPKPRAEGSGNPPDAGRRGATSTGGAGSNPERAASSPRRPPLGE